MPDGITISSFQEAAAQAAQETIAGIIGFIPGFVAALLIFLLGWIIAILISRFFGKILEWIKFEAFLKEQEVEEALGTVVISNVLTKILYYYIIILFLQQAFLYVNLGGVAAFITNVLVYLPVLIGAVLLVLAAAIIGEFVKMRILSVNGKSVMVQYIGRGVKALIVFLGVMAALETAGFKTDIVKQTFLTLLQAVFYGVALAFGLAFGLGGQQDAKEWVGTVRKRLKV
jgi:hypothetical protein